MARRRGTTTSNFGVGARESHDATPFYERFHAPELSSDDTVLDPAKVADAIGDPFKCGDARNMEAIPDGSVALVVTSPPYFAGKQYEEELDREGVPASYFEYLEMLRDVFVECARKLEPGGRIAVNVANLGRKPYRSLSADVIHILEDDLGLLLRGEVIWQKSEGASGNCAWGSFRSATNPVLRDITERVVIASKGRFDRALSVKERERAGLPHVTTIKTDDFMAETLDLWEIPPESARRVGHPAPFPVELPEQLIWLYTFENDLVLDPFVGSGSTLVAAARNGRRFVGYDLDSTYLAIARHRMEQELEQLPARSRVTARVPAAVEVPPIDDADEAFQSRASREGKAAQKLAEQVLTDAGFHDFERNVRIRGTGVTVNFTARDADDSVWYFDVSGAFTSHRGGLLRTDTVWKSLGRAAALRRQLGDVPLVFLTSHLPRRPSEGDTALRAAGHEMFFDAIAMLSDDGRERLARYAKGGHTERPEPGFWSEAELDAERHVPASLTEITEIATALGTLAPDLASATRWKPAALRNVSDDVWPRLVQWYREGEHAASFLAAFANGRAFQASDDGLRGRVPRLVEWKGPQQPPGDDVIPCDLRIDHVYLVSCKYLSRVLLNAGPQRLFTRLLVGEERSSANWFALCAPSEFQSLYRSAVAATSVTLFPERVDEITRAHQETLRDGLRTREWPEACRAPWAALCRTVAAESAARWLAAMPGGRDQLRVLWRLLRISDAAYFVLGAERSNSLRLRIDSAWDWHQRYELRAFDVSPRDSGQPEVAWHAMVRSRDEHSTCDIDGHVEIRWSHGRFNGAPEAKVYLDTPLSSVPGYNPLS